MERKISLCLDLHDSDIAEINEDNGYIDIIINTDPSESKFLLSCEDVTDSEEGEDGRFIGQVSGTIGQNGIETDMNAMNLQDLRTMKTKVDEAIREELAGALTSILFHRNARMLDFSNLTNLRFCRNWADNLIGIDNLDGKPCPLQYPWAIRLNAEDQLVILTFHDAEDICSEIPALVKADVLEDLLSLLRKYLDNEQYELIPSKNYKDCLELDEKPWDIPYDNEMDELPL